LFFDRLLCDQCGTRANSARKKTAGSAAISSQGFKYPIDHRFIVAAAGVHTSVCSVAAVKCALETPVDRPTRARWSFELRTPVISAVFQSGESSSAISWFSKQIGQMAIAACCAQFMGTAEIRDRSHRIKSIPAL
jgi:hypothetical protein